jgi:hypothetical protein
LKRHRQNRHRYQEFHFHRKENPGIMPKVAARKTSLVNSRATA